MGDGKGAGGGGGQIMNVTGKSGDVVREEVSQFIRRNTEIDNPYMTTQGLGTGVNSGLTADFLQSQLDPEAKVTVTTRSVDSAIGKNGKSSGPGKSFVTTISGGGVDVSVITSQAGQIRSSRIKRVPRLYTRVEGGEGGGKSFLGFPATSVFQTVTGKLN